MILAVVNHPLLDISFLWQVVDLDLLLWVLCTGFNCWYADLFPCLIFAQRPMNDHYKFELSKMCCFGLQQVLAKFIKIPFSIKNISSTAQNLKSIKLFWFSNYVSIVRVSALLPSANKSLQAVTAANFEMSYACACLSNLRKLCWSMVPRAESSAIDFAVKTFNCLLE